ncbi:MAG: hypothetical protein ACODAA_03920, partial [Gemmatimonadota bacterium]
AVRFLAELEGMVSPFYFTDPEQVRDPEPELEEESKWARRRKQTEHATQLGQELGRRWQMFSPTSNAFATVVGKAEILLPEVTPIVDEIWNAWSDIRSGQDTYVRTLHQGEHDEDSYKLGLGDEPRERLTDLRARLKAVLQPLVNLEG